MNERHYVSSLESTYVRVDIVLLRLGVFHAIAPGLGGQRGSFRLKELQEQGVGIDESPRYLARFSSTKESFTIVSDGTIHKTAMPMWILFLPCVESLCFRAPGKGGDTYQLEPTPHGAPVRHR